MNENQKKKQPLRRAALSIRLLVSVEVSNRKDTQHAKIQLSHIPTNGYPANTVCPRTVHGKPIFPCKGGDFCFIAMKQNFYRVETKFSS